MRDSTTTGVAALVQEALAVYANDAAATEVLEGYACRLAEPLRIAVAGMVKA
jgi:hypothetical protein